MSTNTQYVSCVHYLYIHTSNKPRRYEGKVHLYLPTALIFPNFSRADSHTEKLAQWEMENMGESPPFSRLSWGLFFAARVLFPPSAGSPRTWRTTRRRARRRRRRRRSRHRRRQRPPRWWRPSWIWYLRRLRDDGDAPRTCKHIHTRYSRSLMAEYCIGTVVGFTVFPANVHTTNHTFILSTHVA